MIDINDLRTIARGMNPGPSVYSPLMRMHLVEWVERETGTMLLSMPPKMQTEHVLRLTEAGQALLDAVDAKPSVDDATERRISDLHVEHSKSVTAVQEYFKAKLNEAQEEMAKTLRLAEWHREQAEKHAADRQATLDCLVSDRSEVEVALVGALGPESGGSTSVRLAQKAAQEIARLREGLVKVRGFCRDEGFDVRDAIHMIEQIEKAGQELWDESFDVCRWTSIGPCGRSGRGFVTLTIDPARRMRRTPVMAAGPRPACGRNPSGASST